MFFLERRLHQEETQRLLVGEVERRVMGAST
jgi:hypothetical protein